MGSVTVNFADVDSFEPLPEGTYDVEVDKVEVRRNKADDGDYLNWELIVLDGEYENRRLWMITSLKPNALFRLKDVFEQLDVLDDDDEEMEIEWDDDLEPSNSDGPRLLYPEVEGVECVAVVKNEMYDGREKNRVNELLGEQPKSKKSSRKKKDSDNEQVAKARSRSRKRDEDDDEDEDEAPRRSRRRARSDDDDEPRSSRRSRSRDEEEDDDEDEAPRRRSRSSSRSSSATKSRRRRMR